MIALEQALDSGLKYVDIHTDSIYVIKGIVRLGPGACCGKSVKYNTCKYMCI